MAAGRKTGGRNFQPGNKFSQGAPKKAIVEARKLNRHEAEQLLNRFIRMPTNELAQFVKRQTKENGDAPAMETLIATILIKGIQEGDQRRLDFLFDRLIGKVTEKMEVQMPRPTVIQMIDSTAQVILGSEIKKEIDDEQ